MIYIIILVGFLTYVNNLTNGFVWDDKGTLYSSPFTHPLFTIKDAFISQGQAGYRPLLYLYWNCITIISQGNLGIIHFFQIGIFLTGAVLLFLFLKMFVHKNIAFCISLLFLVHPLNAEAVDYMAAVSDVLVFLFGMIVLYRLAKDKILKDFFISGFFLLLALLSNEAGISFVCIAIIYLIFFKRVKIAQIGAFLVLPLSVYGYLKLFVSHSSFQTFSYVPIAQMSLIGRLQTAPKVLFYYLSHFFYPAELAIAQHWTVQNMNINDFLLPLLCDGIIVLAFYFGALYLYYHHKKYVRNYLFFCIWFIVGIAPYLQIVPLDMTVADRWFIIPMVGLLGMIGVIIQTITFSSTKKMIGLVVMAILFLVLSTRTIVRNANWRDGITLFTHDLQTNPNSFDLHAKLAEELMTLGKYDEAFIHAQKAVALKPDDITSLGTLSLLYLRINKPQLAIPYLNKVLIISPKNYLGITNMIYANILENNSEEAKKYIAIGLTFYPRDESLHIFQQLILKKDSSLLH